MAITVAKAWLREGPFDDIDIERGLAADLGTEALRRANGTETTPAEPSGEGLTDLVNDERAFWVVRQLSDELGYDGIRALLQMAANGETAYVGEGEPEQTVTIPTDWRRFVDLAEQRLGSEIVADLAAEHLVDDAEAATLATRNDAVGDYESLVQRADGVAPIGIRNHLTNWEFAEAEPLLTRASDVLDERDRVVELAESKGEEPALPLGELWANAAAVEDFDAVEALILQRESDLNSNSLVRNLLIGLGVLLLVAVGVAVFLFSRRNKKATPATIGAADPSLGGFPAPPPGFGPPTGPPPQPAGGPASSTGAVDLSTLPSPPQTTIDVANLPPPGSGPAAPTTPADLASFPAPGSAPSSLPDAPRGDQPGDHPSGGDTSGGDTSGGDTSGDDSFSGDESGDGAEDGGGTKPDGKAGDTVVVDRPEGPPTTLA